MFAGRPVASGQSTKVYACNFVAGTGSKWFVQVELMGDRLQNVLVNRQEKVVDQSKEIVA